MNLSGTRAALAVNIAVVFITCTNMFEFAYLVNSIFGIIHINEIWPIFLPALAALLIRRVAFSFGVLMIQVFLFFILNYGIWRIYSGNPLKYPGPWLPPDMALFFSLVWLCIYCVLAGVAWLGKFLDSKGP